MMVVIMVTKMMMKTMRTSSRFFTWPTPFGTCWQRSVRLWYYCNNLVGRLDFETLKLLACLNYVVWWQVRDGQLYMCLWWMIVGQVMFIYLLACVCLYLWWWMFYFGWPCIASSPYFKILAIIFSFTCCVNITCHIASPFHGYIFVHTHLLHPTNCKI